ncbi:hypothetical protein [Bradyrhizobium sp. CCBAU 45389]|uniref:hypothetical protein n=1 Tax=Bradyrhizobium sp. CCBAU 45389 TaxID=858429 RepID=UPI0023067639|nr:hypothetical protein [Bradyrhizobium sp. CCBAU 45389]
MGAIRHHDTRPANPIQFAADYPNQYRFQSAEFFRDALGGCGASSFEFYLSSWSASEA